jgi:pimeloyl-ACP methyl ester carboxylesterase
MVVDMDPAERSQVMDSPYYVNSQALAGAFIKNDPKALSHVLFDHTTNDWRDVVRRKVNVPVALFSGDLSHNLPSYRWMKSVMPNATLYAYTQEEKGDHFLMFKNPIKFTRDLQAFLER